MNAGRPCQSCSSPMRGEVDELLSEGVSPARVSAIYGISISSLKRHRAGHLVAGKIAVRPETRGPVAVARRLSDIADDSRRVRAAAMAQGNGGLAIRSGLAEARALEVLADRMGVEHESLVDQVEEAVVILDALRRLTPEEGAPLLRALTDAGHSEMADDIADRFQPSTNDRRALAS